MITFREWLLKLEDLGDRNIDPENGNADADARMRDDCAKGVGGIAGCIKNSNKPPTPANGMQMKKKMCRN